MKSTSKASAPLSAIARMGLRGKLALANFIMVTVIIMLMLLAVNYGITEAIHDRGKREIQSTTQTLVGVIEATDRDLTLRASQAAEALKKELGTHLIVSSETIFMDGREVPLLLRNGATMNMDHLLVDRFKSISHVEATLFVKHGNDYIRVSTSLTDQDGNRVIGTVLDPKSLAYQALQAQKTYAGLLNVFGRDYMTHYETLKNDQGEVVGAIFVGINFSEQLNNLKTAIRNIKVGDTGYMYVLNARPGEHYGTLLVHPEREGENIIDVKDTNGRPFIREIIETKNGLITYPWMNKTLGDTHPRDKIVAVSTFENWQWAIAGGTYLHEYTGEADRLMNLFKLISLGVVALLSFIWFVLIGRMVVQPLSQAVKAADAIAAGDLTQTVQTQRVDEVGHLLHAINRIGQGLSSVVKAVRMRADGVAVASAEISQGNQDLSARTENQASALEETAASMEQLGSTVVHNAENARQADHMAQSASEVVRKGGDVVAQVVETMREINQSSTRIGDIIGVIDGIAFQTNILALNAAVEAARAGEHGHGFAVVANEVRTLASRSAEAAKEIKNLINTSVNRVEQGSALVAQARDTMNEAVQSIERMTALMRDISQASTEQSSGVAQVGEAVTQMDQTTQQNAALVEEMAAAALSLASQSQELVASVSVFRIDHSK